MEKDTPNIVNPEKVAVEMTGGIITTLTTELPTFAAAMRELIKNAYDASAQNVDVSLDTNAKKITITDDGDGMDDEEMKKLFKIGRSGKKYGAPFSVGNNKETRYYQGSKGIGFLSALHFGAKAKWISTKEGGQTWTLECRKRDLEKLENLQGANLYLIPTRKRKKGTSIEIDLDNYNFVKVEQIFEDDTQVSKIYNTFRNSSIRINIRRDGITRKCEKLANFYNINKNNIFYVKISSENKMVAIYSSDKTVRVFSLDYDNKQFLLDGELSILDLRDSRVKDITKLFINSNGALAPLVYINDSLFEDYSLFDPEIFRRQRSKGALPQIIGYIDVKSTNGDLLFSSDRTRMVDSTLSDAIRSTIFDLNKNIQKIASEYKDSVDKELKRGFRIDSNRSESSYIQVPDTYTYVIGAPDINLTQLVGEAKDSLGQNIPLDKISIYINGAKLLNQTLPSQTAPCKLNVRFEYIDDDGVEISQNCQLVIEKKRKIRNVPPPVDLLPFSIVSPKNSYMRVCARLTDQINLLYKSKIRDYREIIACSLRAVIELSVFSLRNNSKAPAILRKPLAVEQAIEAFFSHVNVDKHTMTLIANRGEIDFLSMQNMKADEFTSMYRLSHRGAHKSSSLLSKKDLEDIALKASMLSHMVSVLISNEK